MIKKAVFLLAVLLAVTPAFALVDSITEYLEEVDEFYYLAVGMNGSGGDSLAASEIALMLLQDFKVDIQPVTEVEISEKLPKILVGHPCDVQWYDREECEAWPYSEGEALIQVRGKDLLVAGSTVSDTRRAAKVLANYVQFPLLSEELEVVVKGSSFNLEEILVEEKLTEKDFVCGDGVCMSGEKMYCYADCAQKSCYDLCVEKGLSVATCRVTPSNPNVQACNVTEESAGRGYCAGGRTCCCGREEHGANTTMIQSVEAQEEVKSRLSFFERIKAWLMSFFNKLFYE